MVRTDDRMHLFRGRRADVVWNDSLRVHIPLKAAFHDTDTDILADILARIVARMSARRATSSVILPQE